MKTLMEANAICPGDGMNMVRVWMIQAQVVVSYSKESKKSTSVTSDLTSPKGSTSMSTASTSTASWFGGLLSSSTSTDSSAGTSTTPTSTISHSISAPKNAVSSSHGQAGGGHLNAKDLEKLALDILSSLLQLLELRDLPVSPEQWTQSVTLCCLLYLPNKPVVRQAAHSTLPQVLTLLVKDNIKLAVATWEDLLSCTLGIQQRDNLKKKRVLHGAFAHCKFGDADAAQVPSPTLSLELLTGILKEYPQLFSEVGPKTLGGVVSLLQKSSSLSFHHQQHPSSSPPLEFVRLLQFSLVIIQTQSKEWPAECRELLLRIIQPIPIATEAIRHQADFEDGFIYKQSQKHSQSLTSNPSKAAPSSSAYLETLRGLPSTCLWKASLCLETVKMIVQDSSLKPVWMQADCLVQLLEATSDFCTIGASCQDHMGLLVASCRQSKPSLFYYAESLAMGDSSDWWQHGKDKEDQYILGDALWIGIGAILKMIDSLDATVLEAAFAPSLAVLQHYLKRFPASGTIVKKSLEGYFSLAKVAVHAGPLLRRALLTSLCKLSLPQFGKHDSTSLLRDHNVAALICLLNVIHRYYNAIGSEWHIVLQTFQELSVLSISSPHLSDSAYVGALSISAVYSRFASFSTILLDESLLHFVQGLKEVSIADQTPNVIASPVGGADIRIPDKQQSDERDGEGESKESSIGEKLMNMGVRAIYGSGDGSSADDDVPLAERTKNTYFHDYNVEFCRRLASSKHPIRADTIPFASALMADVAMANSFRFERCAATLSRELCSLASEAPQARKFAMDAVAMLIMSQIAEDEMLPASFVGPGRIMYEDPRQNQYLAVERVDGELSQAEKRVVQRELLAPLCESIRTVKVASVAEAGVEALSSILESAGHELHEDLWPILIDAIASLSSADRSSSDWANSNLVGFRCLKLVVDDFLDQTDSSSAARSALLDCCSSFGASRHDVNTSLTAIGLLWSIADQDAGNDSIDVSFGKLFSRSCASFQSHLVSILF